MIFIFVIGNHILTLQEKMESQKMESLNKRLTYYNKRYFQDNISEISDFKYDILFNELKALEAKNPHLVHYSSITNKVGYDSSKVFPNFTHPLPMLSLDKALNEEEFLHFIEDREKILKGPLNDLFLSLKYDGLALELVYKNGELMVGSTRGNGTIGENITTNVKRIKNIPQEIKAIDPKNSEEIVIIRGEAIFPISEFKAINQEQAKANKTAFSNPRNAVSGTMRQLESEKISQKNITFFAFEISNFRDFIAAEPSFNDIKSHLDYLKKSNFSVSEHNAFVSTSESVIDYYKKINELRSTMDYEIDGIVIKINDPLLQDKLGIVGRKPRYSIAWKFPPEVKVTELLDVKFQIGRTGKITPVGILEPVFIGGAEVSRVTLHNEQEIKSKDIKIGDQVIVTRSGDVIPKVIGVKQEKRSEKVRDIVFPDLCPTCSTKLKKNTTENLTFCPNENCPNRAFKKILHFISKEAMNIDGIGKEVIKELIKQSKISNASDLYTLKSSDFDAFPRMGEKLKEKYLQAIYNSKKTTLSKFIYALGISGVGEKLAFNLANKFKSIENLFHLSEEVLQEMNEIGDVLSDSITTFFNDPHNISLIKKMINLGVSIHHVDKKSGRLKGKKVLFTGTLSLPRHIVKEKAEAAGGEIVSSVSKKLSYLIIGENPGNKKTKAEALAVPILNEKEFMDLVN